MRRTVPFGRSRRRHRRAVRPCLGVRAGGDQPRAIAEIIAGVKGDERDQVLLGVIGSGKTFTMAHVIRAIARPTLILAP